MSRSIPLCIILSIFTCGIYGIYWMIVLNDEINAASGQPGTPGVAVFLLTLITCNIYGLYWMYKMGGRVEIINGGYSSSTGILYLVLSLFGLGIVSYALMQSELNRIYGGSY